MTVCSCARAAKVTPVRCLPARNERPGRRCRSAERPSTPNSGRHRLRCACELHCIPGRPICATAITTVRQSIAVLGFARRHTVGRRYYRVSRMTWCVMSCRTGVELRDLGEHNLKDLQRPEHIYQLNVVGVPSEFPALKTLNSLPNNLPAQRSLLVGRIGARRHSHSPLEGEVGLLTLTGPEGMEDTLVASGCC